VCHINSPSGRHPHLDCRRRAVASLYRRTTTLSTAIARLGFVQADPIRAPATAQDLILRHRVTGYRAGELERRYASCAVEEEYLYAYGFVPRATRALLQPRKTRPMSKLEARCLAIVRERGETHPRDLESELGARRVVNAWGGYSKATTRALDFLHYRGDLRVLRRDGGTRVYAEAAPFDPMPHEKRLRALVLLVAAILAPVPVKTLRANIARFRKLGDPRSVLRELVVVDGWAWPADMPSAEEAPAEVRLLAPFDPVVWDRHRFEQLWGWRYRFEAYTPMAKRVRGYYAMPLLWRDAVIGWANASRTRNGLDVDVGFVSRRPRDAAFSVALDAEIDRLERFLVP
jgi:uncharacterized protein YcaQ